FIVTKTRLNKISHHLLSQMVVYILLKTSCTVLVPSGHTNTGFPSSSNHSSWTISRMTLYPALSNNTCDAMATASAYTPFAPLSLTESSPNERRTLAIPCPLYFSATEMSLTSKRRSISDGMRAHTPSFIFVRIFLILKIRGGKDDKSTGVVTSCLSSNPDNRTPTTSPSLFLTTTLVPLATLDSVTAKYRSCASSLVIPMAPFNDRLKRKSERRNSIISGTSEGIAMEKEKEGNIWNEGLKR
ncbi:hypothetical protein PENTCL1PPCAC_26773, partial [Pristionchus entomophagus]